MSQNRLQIIFLKRKQMKNTINHMKHVIYVFLFFMLLLFRQISTNQTNSNNYSDCIGNCSNVQNYPGICTICYNQCTKQSQITIKSCVRLTCFFYMHRQCFYYSQTALNETECMNSCCANIDNINQTSFTYQQMGTCFIDTFQTNNQTNFHINQIQSSNIGLVLGITFGSLSVFILIACMCCRRRLKACWLRLHGHPQQIHVQKKLDPRLAQIKGNQIKYISEQQSKTQFQYQIDDQCTICLTGQTQLKTRCGHWFHLACLTEWLIKTYKCPNCVGDHFNPIQVICQKCKKVYAEIKVNQGVGCKKIIKNMSLRCSRCQLIIQSMQH